MAVMALAVVLVVLVRSDAAAPNAARAPAPAPQEPVRSPIRADAAPVVRAADAVAANEPGEARRALIHRIREPRPGHEPWDDAGLALLRTLSDRAASTSDLGCYMAGCIATFTFASNAVYERAVADWQGSPAYAACGFEVGKQLTAPSWRKLAADGSIVIAVVVGRPDFDVTLAVWGDGHEGGAGARGRGAGAGGGGFFTSASRVSFDDARQPLLVGQHGAWERAIVDPVRRGVGDHIDRHRRRRRGLHGERDRRRRRARVALGIRRRCGHELSGRGDDPIDRRRIERLARRERDRVRRRSWRSSDRRRARKLDARAAVLDRDLRKVVLADL